MRAVHMRGMSVLITSGRFTELFHKGAVEPGVVAKAAGEIGFRDRRPCADRIGTAVQPLLRNVLMGRQTDQVLEEMHKRGIPTVVWLTPILPFINDTEENIRQILEACARVKVKGIICFDMGVTLREGDREYFYAALDRHFPGLKERYIRT